MVTEKTAAMVEGAFAAQMEIVKLAGAAMTGSLKVQDIPHMPAAIAAAGLRSAFRTVKANSRRLSRRRCRHVHFEPLKIDVDAAGIASAL